MRTAAIVNLKGGVGKSTTAINLALIMATVYKYRVLLVDNDIQANVSKFFGVHSYDYKSMENVLRDTDTMAEDVIRSSGRVGLDIIPANMNMDAAAVDLMLDQEANQIVRLKDVLDQVEEQYDYCLIDCPPGVGINVLNALAAADDVIIPIKADKNAFRFMAKNCIAVYDEMLGVKYSKKKSKFKIDGIIAMLMGLLLCIEENGIEHYNPVEYLDAM